MVYSAPLVLELQEVPEPTVAGGEVLIEVKAAGICGSELEGFATRSPFRVPPLIMGHEFAGVRLDTGEHVAVNPLVCCGRCDLCARGLTNICRDRKIIGINRPGGFAELVAVPEQNCYAAREDVPFTTLALAEPLANAVHAFRQIERLEPWPQQVGIIGAGAIGLSLALISRSRGVPRTVISDLDLRRLEWATQLGIETMVGDLHGEFDVVFDSVGTPQTRQLSTDLLRPGGTAMWVGLHAAEAAVDVRAMIRREVRVLTTFCYDAVDFRDATRYTETLEPAWLRTEPLERGVEVFTELLDGPVAASKTVLVCSPR